MQIQINDMLRAYIEPLTEAEHEALERSLLAEGCRDALVLWGDVLVDGGNSYFRDSIRRAEALRAALRALGRITGRVGVEAVLDAVFAEFCIGK